MVAENLNIKFYATENGDALIELLTLYHLGDFTFSPFFNLLFFILSSSHYSQDCQSL